MDRPSDTTQGSTWLGNFLPEEKALAKLLLDSLQICFDSTLRAKLASLLKDVVDGLTTPIAIVPVRELGSPTPSNSDEESIGPEEAIFPPLDQPFQPLAGSEGLVGNVIRESLGAYPDRTRLSYPESIDDMRNVRTRSILLVEDYCGTGDRMQGYVDHWMRNKTIRSWHSYGFIRFHVASYAISSRALKKLKRNPKIESVRYSTMAADFASAKWTPAEAAGIRDICRKYSKMSNMTLGFKESEALFVMQHTVPNNTPCILWQNRAKGVKDWVPLFADRRMSPNMQETWSDYVLEQSSAQRELDLRQLASRGELAAAASGDAALVVIEMLQAAEQGIRAEVRLARYLGMTESRAAELKALCIRMGLLDMAGRLTDAGRSGLKEAQPEPLEPGRSSRLKGSDLPYYPESLRGVRDV
ncbi:phosphoribosyltransferase-like protein [Streptomyces sp. NPDC003703]|uniref:phosphoribosyltransferase-like protein n=1 Tax=Streptomyces sp. NPDC003283 TaxID=3364681 RepID=UPI0036925297